MSRPLRYFYIAALLAAAAGSCRTALAQLSDDSHVTSPPAWQNADTDENRLIKGSGDQTRTHAWPDHWQWLRTIGALALVVALVFGARRLLKRVAPVGTAGAARAGAIEILGRASLSPRHHLALVKLADTLVLVGYGPHGVARLAEVTDRAKVQSLIELAKQGGLAGVFRRRGADAAVTSQHEGGHQSESDAGGPA